MGSVGWYVLAIVLFATVLMIVDAVVGYKKAKVDDMFGVARRGAELKGVSGYRRSIIALTVILILAISVFHLLGREDDPSSVETIDNVLGILAGLTAAVVGFYFGGRFTEKRAEAAEEAARKADEMMDKVERAEKIERALEEKLTELLLELEELRQQRDKADDTSGNDGPG